MDDHLLHYPQENKEQIFDNLDYLSLKKLALSNKSMLASIREYLTKLDEPEIG